LPKQIKDVLRPIRRAIFPDKPVFVGYVRSRSATEITGWIHDPVHPDVRLGFEVVLNVNGVERVLAAGVADAYDMELASLGLGDGQYAFRVKYPEALAPAQIDQVGVRPAGFRALLQDAGQALLGYVRERSTRHVAGWVRDAGKPGQTMTVEVRYVGPGAERVLARAPANLPDPLLAAAGVSDAACGFRIAFSPELTQEERDHLVVRCTDANVVLPMSEGGLLGYVRERSTRHVAGWARREDDPGARLELTVVCAMPGAEREIARVVADQADRVLAASGFADAKCGFRVDFATELSEAERDHLVVRSVANGQELPMAEAASPGYVRELTTRHVAGWMRLSEEPSRRLAYRVVCTLPGRERELGRGVADRHDRLMAASGYSDANCGFRFEFAEELSEAERDRIAVRFVETGAALPRAVGATLGYVRECTTQHVAGWMRREDNPDRRLSYTVRCTLPGAERVLAAGVADLRDDTLADLGFEDAGAGFRATFAEPLTDAERDHVEVWPEGAEAPLARARSIITGYMRERSERHVAGWIYNNADPAERVAFEVVVMRGEEERVIGRGVADQFDRILFALGFEDAVHGFRLMFDAPISPDDSEYLEVRPIATGKPIAHDPAMQTSWKPVRYIAMDIVDNCNLRCPFCLFDHAPVHKTTVMSDEIFAAALKWLPYVGPEGLWMSCLHEPTMHPKLVEFINRIPREYRNRMHYTTNLSRRMPEVYWETLANSGLSNLNVSIESRDPAIYEKMRKGAKHRIFMENWDKLLAAFAKGSAPPPLRYVCMAYKSNVREIPSLIEYLRTERRAWKVEIRDTFDVPWIPQEFRDTEYLDRPEWEWLRDQLAHYDPTEVTLSLPPDFDAVAVPACDDGGCPPPVSLEPVSLAPPVMLTEEEGGAPPPAAPSVATLDDLRAKKAARVPGMIEARILHDGLMIVSASAAGNYPNYGEELIRLNIIEIEDPAAFIMSL